MGFFRDQTTRSGNMDVPTTEQVELTTPLAVDLLLPPSCVFIRDNNLNLDKKKIFPKK